MTKKDLGASIRQKLLNLHRTTGRPFNELLQQFTMERFLYRLHRSSFADSFILKGAMALRVWGASASRPTMDIDMLGVLSNSEESIRAAIESILSTDIEPDGLNFDLLSIRTERITEDADYQGIRVRCSGTLAGACTSLQIDIGFGDSAFPEPTKQIMPSLLDFPSGEILCYRQENAIAEKYEAMVTLGVLNSRMKDFFDIWLLARSYQFESRILEESIQKTFERRGTSLVLEPVAFSDQFAEEKQVQWRAFRKRLSLIEMPKNFADVVSVVRRFLLPVTELILAGKGSKMVWNENSWVE